MVVGEAARLTVGRGGGVVTVTVALAELVPLGPTAVKVYVVVAVGDTAMLPLVATVPTPVRVRLVASALLHVNVAD